MLRILHETDLPQILVIENLTQIAPWTADIFQRCWRAGYSSWGIEKDEKIVGFIIVSLQAGETHILNLCIHPNHQRQGLGRQLLNHVLEITKSKGKGIAFLEVRRSNKAAIGLYEKEGFIQIGERKNYYPLEKDREDALVFAKDLGVE